MRSSPHLVVAAVAVVLACVTVASAVGPITVEQCSTINPSPIVTACNYYLPPITDVYGMLPYDTVPAYSDCVKTRCVCTGAAVDTNIVTDGYYCNESGFMESGFTTCNHMNRCFTDYWRCLNTAVMDRYQSGIPITDAEVSMAVEIITHGRTPGERFQETDAYRSCRLIMCAAADSRENCGLVTCLPNYTQCDEYMLPPPLLNTHQLCTQGCRAVLLMMAVTIALVSFSCCCMACCPAAVVVTEPVIQEDAEETGKKAAGDEDEEDEERESTHTGSQQESGTHTNHNSHLASQPSHNSPDDEPAVPRNPTLHGNDSDADSDAMLPRTEAQQRGTDPF